MSDRTQPGEPLPPEIEAAIQEYGDAAFEHGESPSLKDAEELEVRAGIELRDAIRTALQHDHDRIRKAIDAVIYHMIGTDGDRFDTDDHAHAVEIFWNTHSPRNAAVPVSSGAPEEVT